MTEDRIIITTLPMSIPPDRTPRPVHQPWPAAGTKLFADDPEAARDHGSFDGPTK